MASEGLIGQSDQGTPFAYLLTCGKILHPDSISVSFHSADTCVIRRLNFLVFRFFESFEEITPAQGFSLLS
jgi:hypothetical protein